MRTAYPASKPRAFYLNMGGPMTRKLSQWLSASLLGDAGGTLRFPQALCVALDFGARDPLDAIEALFARAGITDPDALRSRFPAPAEPCIARETPALVPLVVAGAAIDAVLAQVLVLGLSTAHCYDPRRPLLFTRSSLTRRLTLYTTREHHA